MSPAMKHDALDKAVATLGAAAATFRRYQEIHAAKPDPVKARANEDMAVLCERALGGLWLAMAETTCLHGEGCQCA